MTQATVFRRIADLGKTGPQSLVLPNLNAGLASLGCVLVNPAVGWVTFLAQYILRDPLQKILALNTKSLATFTPLKLRKIHCLINQNN